MFTGVTSNALFSFALFKFFPTAFGLAPESSYGQMTLSSCDTISQVSSDI
jgi:hypothetical protein